MKITERMQQVEENFNKLKETFEEKQKQSQALQQEMVELEKQIIYVKGAYQMLTELAEETPEEDQICTVE